ncbi:AAEL000275-PA [Aedes aegypti]|uniref:AAEL000275-PA n=1 Tax=Aedes aegypti TaxID=7159 RepID=Q17PP3_AEDAE|nr:AAEL000275-PA [Aedes aegypti]
MLSALGIFTSFPILSNVTSPSRNSQNEIVSACPIRSNIISSKNRGKTTPHHGTGLFVLKCTEKFVKVAPQAVQQPLVSTVRFHFPPVVIVANPPPPDIERSSCRSRLQFSPQGYGIFSGTLGHGRY